MLQMTNVSGPSIIILILDRQQKSDEMITLEYSKVVHWVTVSIDGM